MDNGDADILAGIRELRAKATAQLTGNEYYMVVQQLDQLAELSGEAARSELSRISAKLEGGVEAASAGDPEIPPVPDSPAEPVPPPGPDTPVLPDSPAQPDNPPGPDIPSPVDSPAETPTPPEMMASVDAASPETHQIITPRASSFGSSQPTVAIRTTEVQNEAEAPAAPAETPEPATPTSGASGLSSAVMAARTLVEEKLSGNSYYAAATLLGQLQVLPSGSQATESAVRPEGFDGALALLRQEAAQLRGMAQEEAVRIISALENVLMPQEAVAKVAEAVPAAEAQPEAIASATPAEATAPDAKPEERTSEPEVVASTLEALSPIAAPELATQADVALETEAQLEVPASEPEPLLEEAALGAVAQPDVAASEPETQLAEAAPEQETKAEPVVLQPEAQAEEAVQEPEAQSETGATGEPEPRTGFDDLAEAAWRRVQQLSAADEKPVHLNGGVAPASLLEAVAAAPASVVEAVAAAEPAASFEAEPSVGNEAVASAPNERAPASELETAPTSAVEAEPDAPLAQAATAEMMDSDIGEAFNDGGSESRSSEPCYLHEFELADARNGASDRQEPAAEAGADAASETQREASVSAEAAVETLTTSGEVDPAPNETPRFAADEGARVDAAAVEESGVAVGSDAAELLADAGLASESDADVPAKAPEPAPEPEPAPQFEAELLKPSITPSSEEIAEIAPEGPTSAAQQAADSETEIQAETLVAAASEPDNGIAEPAGLEPASTAPVSAAAQPQAPAPLTEAAAGSEPQEPLVDPVPDAAVNVPADGTVAEPESEVDVIPTASLEPASAEPIQPQIEPEASWLDPSTSAAIEAAAQATLDLQADAPVSEPESVADIAANASPEPLSAEPVQSQPEAPLPDAPTADVVEAARDMDADAPVGEPEPEADIAATASPEPESVEPVQLLSEPEASAQDAPTAAVGEATPDMHAGAPVGEPESEAEIAATTSLEPESAEPVQLLSEPEASAQDAPTAAVGEATPDMHAGAPVGEPESEAEIAATTSLEPESAEPLQSQSEPEAPPLDAPIAAVVEAIPEAPAVITVESVPAASADAAPTVAPIVTAESVPAAPAAIPAETLPPTPTIELTQSEKPARRGFFGRLFGSASADNR